MRRDVLGFLKKVLWKGLLMRLRAGTRKLGKDDKVNWVKMQEGRVLLFPMS